MAYKHTDLKHRKTIISLIIILLILAGVGLYWRYKVNYEMIVTFSETNTEAYDFPVGKRKINASPWIQKGYTKLDQDRIYNPHTENLALHPDIFYAVKEVTEERKLTYPTLFNKINSLDSKEFLSHIDETSYLFSTFNPETDMPTHDHFLVAFYDKKYEIVIVREKINSNAGGYYLWATDLNEAGQFKKDNLEVMNKIERIKGNLK